MGKLFVVPTPVGNLEDITLRALNVLKECDVILAEDTRTSGVLMKHFGIETHMQSYHKFNEHKTTARMVDRMKAGEIIALISDAGTPSISDPGYMIVRDCISEGVEVECLRVLQLLCLHLLNQDYPMTVSVLKGFFPKKGKADTSKTTF